MNSNRKTFLEDSDEGIERNNKACFIYFYYNLNFI